MVSRKQHSRIFASHAPRYAEVGLLVLPLAEKIPAIKGGHGVKDGSSDAAIVATWGHEFPDANIGIACGGRYRLVVIDIDPRNGGHRTIEILATQGFGFPVCPEALTGNRGRHLYMLLPEDQRISAFKLGDGIDVQWTGKYVVAPPSVTGPSSAGPGGEYRWLRDPWTTPFPELPKWAIERLAPRRLEPTPYVATSPQTALRRLDGLAAFLASTPSGNRNNALNWAAYRAGELVRDGKLSPDTVVQTLWNAARSAGLDEHRIAPTIASALRAASIVGGAENG